MKTRRVLTLVLALLLLVSITGCSGAKESAAPESTAPESTAPESSAPESSAPEYPTQAITITCPTAAGGAIDLVIRAIATEMEDTIGQNITIVNKDGGAAGAIAEYYATAQPDGYSLFVIDKGMLSNYATGTFSVGYEDFEPIGQIDESSQLLVCNAELPYESIEDVVEAAAAAPETISIGCSGSTGISFLSVYGFISDAGAPLKIVPYSGGAELKAAVSGGDVALASLKTSEAASLVDGGYLRVLACCGAERDEAFPDAPTLLELGVDFSITQTTSLWAPSGTDPQIIAILADALESAVASDSFKELCETNLTAPSYLGPDELEQYSADEYAKIFEMLDAAGLAKK